MSIVFLILKGRSVKIMPGQKTVAAFDPLFERYCSHILKVGVIQFFS